MGRVRPLTEDDLGQVTDLYLRGLRGSSPTASPQALSAYIAEVFMQNPWCGEGGPSLVYDDGRGRIVGVLGVIPRRMAMNGRMVRTAVSTSFVVERASRSTLAGIELMRAFLSGPQDLSVTDAANDATRKIWERLGGQVALLYSFEWSRSLRPRRHALYKASKQHPWLRPVASWTCTVGRGAEAAIGVASARRRRARPEVFGEELEPKTLLEGLSQVSADETLRPAYDEASLAWLLAMAERKRRHGRLRKALVRDGDGRILGWWLYYLNPLGSSQVLQFGATKASVDDVLGHLIDDARSSGALALGGRLPPAFARELTEHGCRFTCGSWVLVHARDPELGRALHRGDAFLSRLEGEWWTCFREFIARGRR